MHFTCILESVNTINSNALINWIHQLKKYSLAILRIVYLNPIALSLFIKDTSLILNLLFTINSTICSTWWFILPRKQSHLKLIRDRIKKNHSVVRTLAIFIRAQGLLDQSVNAHACRPKFNYVIINSVFLYDS